MLRCPVPTDLSRSGRLTGAGSVLLVRMFKEVHGRVKRALMMGLSVLYLCIYDFWFLRLKSLPLFSVVRIRITGLKCDFEPNWLQIQISKSKLHFHI